MKMKFIKEFRREGKSYLEYSSNGYRIIYEKLKQKPKKKKAEINIVALEKMALKEEMKDAEIVDKLEVAGNEKNSE